MNKILNKFLSVFVLFSLLSSPIVFAEASKDLNILNINNEQQVMNNENIVENNQNMINHIDNKQIINHNHNMIMTFMKIMIIVILIIVLFFIIKALFK